ncbi:hypothetical protein ACFWP7_32875 [Streptomyces sp. NPDC058470]|uniref:hypothetical protein n=1 Tax=Streptomyces sp. NPDC058470 TaxID=3346515 RepID=UPI00364750EC
MQKIPSQVNEGWPVALPPNGHADLLAASARELIERHNAGRSVAADEPMSHMRSYPLRRSRWTGSAPVPAVYTIQFCRRPERAVGQEKCGRSVVHVDSLGDVDPYSNCVSGQGYRAGNMPMRSFARIGEHGFDEFRDIRCNGHSARGPCPVAREDVWCPFRCPPPARNTPPAIPRAAVRPITCSSGRYWGRRKQRDVRLAPSPSSVTSQPPHSPPTVQGESRGRRP